MVAALISLRSYVHFSAAVNSFYKSVSWSSPTECTCRPGRAVDFMWRKRVINPRSTKDPSLSECPLFIYKESRVKLESRTEREMYMNIPRIAFYYMNGIYYTVPQTVPPVAQIVTYCSPPQKKRCNLDF